VIDIEEPDIIFGRDDSTTTRNEEGNLFNTINLKPLLELKHLTGMFPEVTCPNRRSLFRVPRGQVIEHLLRNPKDSKKEM
jgi:hypothetical protein